MAEGNKLTFFNNQDNCNIFNIKIMKIERHEYK